MAAPTSRSSRRSRPGRPCPRAAWASSAGSTSGSRTRSTTAPITSSICRKKAGVPGEIGMVFQQFNLFPHLTALENITLAPRLVRKIGRAAARERAMALLAKMGLAEKAHARPIQLSGGQQQRLAIARSLAMDPKVMLFDEVTSALDRELVFEVLGVMRQLALEGMTMLVVTHELWFAKNVADRIVLLAGGELVEEAPPDDFFNAPRMERTKRFLRELVLESPDEPEAAVS